ncbi:succinate dehydrogenase, hydrophobic membrane anchor protein [Lentibacter algarum]|uniref:succinate dehydrogenase, hydrophobic membrane anchor protein n=1 Tax=Lentibacter algarum TaxID=576131 RepID=UPI001C084D16|nr:succinate dehydrogenase, hydrophobic membrane anchor protein [Lentibacter algarum]MBU2983537.1 succinate dehydrogenase, hydrophobic membrane anchor protein [Lentibacter algarum]
MRYLTDRKRAVGSGSAREGTHHHWQHFVSSVLLQVLLPLFVITFACAFGGSFEEVVAYYAQPFPLIVTTLTLIVGMLHLMREVHEAIEDYVHGPAEKLLIIASQGFAYTVIAVGLFALIRLAAF